MRINWQTTTIIDDNNDGIIEAVEFDFQRVENTTGGVSGTTATKKTADPTILAFIQRIYDLIKSEKP